MIQLSQLTAAEEFVLSDESCGFLTLGWRHRLWDELLDVDYEFGSFRRTALGLLAAEETLPRWEQIEDIPDFFFELPWQILGYCRTVMADRIPDPDVRYRGYYHFARRVDWFRSEFESEQRVPNDDEYILERVVYRTYALEASLAALHRANWWGPFPEEDYDVSDWQIEYKDAHCLAAWDCCDDSMKASLQREYWLHWLKELFPRVLVDIDELRQDVAS